MKREKNLGALVGVTLCAIVFASNLARRAVYSFGPQETGGCLVSLDFDQDGILPSSQGLSYFSDPTGIAESTVFSVGGGLLSIDTFSTGGTAGYQLLNAFDPALNFELEFRMKVYPGTGTFGIDFEVSDSVSDFEFGFADNGITLPPGPSGRPFLPFNTTDDFHTYRVFSPGGVSGYHFFIDGVLVFSGAVVPGGDPGQRFIFGDLTGGANGRADLDFIRYCQSPPACVPAPAGLIGWWPGDGDALDISSANHGTVMNGASFAPGLVGQAFSFDGIDDFVHIPNSAPLSTAGSFTVDLWFNPATDITPSTAASPGLFSKGASDSINFANNDGRIEVRGPFPRPNSTTDTWPAGLWYHLAVTFDTMSYRVFVNGVEQGSLASGHSILSNGNDIVLGAIPGFAPAVVTFSGLIDEVEVFNRALSSAEIQGIYNAGSAGKCKCAAVQIDIKPGSFPNSINLGSNGSVPVAIFSSASFDATTVDPTTVTLASASVRLRGNGTPMASFQDVNGDGLLDLVVQVSTQALQLSETDTDATLEGRTIDGGCIKGVDSIRVVQ